VFTFLDLEFFNSENVKNKECVYTGANSGYIHYGSPIGPTFGGMFMRQYCEVVNYRISAFEDMKNC
jgi:hypothetical protein